MAQRRSVEKYFYLKGGTLNCCATNSANSSLFFFLWHSTSSFLAVLPRRFLPCCSSSLDFTISSLTRLFENTGFSDSRAPRSYKSNSPSLCSGRLLRKSGSLAGGVALSYWNSFSFLAVTGWQ